MQTENPKPKIFELLAKSLKDLAGEIIDEDKAKIEKRACVARNTLMAYLNGNVAKVETAKKIIKVGREEIIKRNQLPVINTTAA